MGKSRGHSRAIGEMLLKWDYYEHLYKRTDPVVLEFSRSPNQSCSGDERHVDIVTWKLYSELVQKKKQTTTW